MAIVRNMINVKTQQVTRLHILQLKQAVQCAFECLALAHWEISSKSRVRVLILGGLWFSESTDGYWIEEIEEIEDAGDFNSSYTPVRNTMESLGPGRTYPGRIPRQFRAGIITIDMNWKWKLSEDVTHCDIRCRLAETRFDELVHGSIRSECQKLFSRFVFH